MPLRRLEDRIRELCAQAIAAGDSADLDTIVAQLRAALHEHTRRLRVMAARLVSPPESPPLERRNRNPAA